MRTSSRSPWSKRSAPGHRPISPPAEPAVEGLESFPASCFESQLLEAQFVTGNVTNTAHQRGADASAAEVGVGLHPFDRAPVRNDPVPVPAQAQPAGEDTAGCGQQEPAVLGSRLGDELIRDRCHVVDADRGNANPTAPPLLATVIQQLTSSRVASGVMSCGRLT